MELSIKMLKAGKHVLSEKPMAMNSKQAKSVLDTANANNKLFIEVPSYNMHSALRTFTVSDNVQFLSVTF